MRDALSAEAVAAADPRGMLGDVLAQPDQVGDALWRVEAAAIPRVPHRGGLVVCGMGGSAIGGDLAAAAIGRRARAPITTVRGYELPGWVGPDTLVLCASYSGETEETLECFERAGDAGAPRVAMTTGGSLAERARATDVPVIGVPAGMQPRAAVVYATIAALECAASAGVAPSLHGEIEEGRQLLAQLALDWEADAPADPEPKRLARALHGHIALIYGGRLTSAVARRWRSQLNENAKVPAFYGELPEAHHNEVVGWPNADGSFTAILLEAPSEHGRMSARFDVTAEAAAAANIPVERVRARGESDVARVMSLVFLGDLVSVYLAVLNGVDPTPVDAIADLKRRLGAV